MMLFTGLLPFIAFILLWLSLGLLLEGTGLRRVFVYASVLWGVFIVAITELLSNLSAVNFLTLLLSWVLFVTLIIVVLVLKRSSWTSSIHERFDHIALESWPARILGVGILAILAATLLVAIFAPPNNWDALNYHMSRVAHWAQQGSIHHFATGIEYQNYLPPGNAIFILHTYLLARGDRLVNLVQWFSMLGSLVVVSYIAKLLSAKPAGQIAAAVFAVTLPMGLMQATSATSDYFTAFWLVITAALVLELSAGKLQPITILATAAGAGLSYLAKPTALPFLLPFGIWTGIAIFRQSGWRKAVRWAVLGSLVFTAINVGHSLRNLRTYGNPGGPEARIDLHLNEPIGARSLVSSLLKNMSLHAGTPSPHFNKGVALVVLEVHEWIGLDVNDPGLTAEGTYRIKGNLRHETVAGNFPHAVFILISVPVLFLRAREIPERGRLYAAVTLAAFILFSLIFKWKETGSRYHLPFFLLYAPVAGLLLGLWGREKAALAVQVLLLVWAVPWAVGNQARPLLPKLESAFVDSVLVEEREDLYFANAPYLRTPYIEMTDLVRQESCGKVGVSIPGASLEYPLWALLGAPEEQLEMRWVVSGTPSDRYVQEDFQPCAVICDACPVEWESVRGLPLYYDRSPFRLYLAEQ